MILVDTSVWIRHFRLSDPDLIQRLEDRAVLMHPIVVGELACGNLPRRAEVLGTLWKLPSGPRASDEEALGFIERHRLMGRGISYTDVHLLASAVLARDARSGPRMRGSSARQPGCSFPTVPDPIMAKRTTKKPKEVAALVHEEATRRNIPTAEYQSMLRKEAVDPRR